MNRIKPGSSKTPVSAGNMKIEQHAPSQVLAPYIRCYWQIKHYLPEGGKIQGPFGCTGRSHFVFTLKNPFSASLDQGDPLEICQSTFFCQLCRPIIKFISGPTLAVIVDFNATGFNKLWNLPVHELSERSYDLTTIVSTEIRQVTEQMQQADTAHQRFSLPDRYFLSRLAKVKRQDGRIQRFLRTRFWLEHQTRPSWNDILLTTGYYDQSHLVNEFRFFSGKSPLQYGAGNSDLHDIFRQEYTDKSARYLCK